MESVNSLRISAPPWWPLREGRDGKCEGRNEKCEFLARESVSSSPIVRIFGKGKCKFIANFSTTMVTSLPSLSLSLSLYLSLSHRKYLTHNIGSASALPIIQVNPVKTNFKGPAKMVCLSESSSYPRQATTAACRSYSCQCRKMRPQNAFVSMGTEWILIWDHLRHFFIFETWRGSLGLQTGAWVFRFFDSFSKSGSIRV